MTKDKDKNFGKEPRVLPFKQDSYKKWSSLVTSKAIEKGWGKVLFSTAFNGFKLSPENYYSDKGVDGTTAITDDEKDDFEMNAKAWSYLEEATKDDPTAYGILLTIKNRNAYKAWKELKGKFDKTNDAIDMNTMENDWNSCCMGSDLEDPDLWFMELTRMRNEIEENVPDLKKNDVVTSLKIIGNLPNLYQPVVAALNLQDKVTDVEEVQIQVRKHYKQFVKDKSPEEMAMVNYTPAADRKKKYGGGYRKQGPGDKFTGKCFNCGRLGHRKSDCWAEGGPKHSEKASEKANAASDKKAKESAPCFLCDKLGHKAADCKESMKKKKAQFAGMVCHATSSASSYEYGSSAESLYLEHDRTFFGVHDDMSLPDMPYLSYLQDLEEEDSIQDLEEEARQTDEKCFKASSSLDSNSWLLDSGSSVHITNCSKNLTKVRSCNVNVTIGDGWTVNAKKKGTVLVSTEEGCELTLKNVLFIPGFDKKLLSVKLLIANGNKVVLDNDGAYLIQKSSGKSLAFRRGDCDMFYLTECSKERAHDAHTPSESDPIPNVIEYESDEVSTESNKEPTPTTEETRVPTALPAEPPTLTSKKAAKHRLEGKTMAYDEAHAKFGHQSREGLRKIAKKMGLRLTGTLSSCSACLMEAAKQSNVAKLSTTKSTVPGERLAIDTTGPFPRAFGGITYVVCVVDEATGYSMSYFSKDKKQIGEHLEAHLRLVEQQFGVGRTKYLRCDNAGENIKYLTPVCNNKNIKIERTPPDSPQYNGKVEQRIRLNWMGSKKLLASAGLTFAMRSKLWPSAWTLFERMDNMSKPIELWESERALRIISNPIQFGRVGYTFTGKKTKKSLKSGGVRCIMVGYGGDAHSSNTYMVYKPSTDKIVCTKNVQWEDWHGVLASAKIMDVFDLDTSSLGEEDSSSSSTNEASSDESSSSSSSSSDSSSSEDSSDGSSSDESSDTPSSEESSDSSEESSNDSSSNKSSSDSKGSDGTSTDNTFEHPTTFKERTRGAKKKAHPYLLKGRTRSAQRQLTKETAKFAKLAQTSHIRSQLLEKFECAMNALSSDPSEPSNWKEMWSEPQNRKDWHESACKEIENFLRRSVWHRYPRENLKDRKPIGVRWVFKIKNEHDGTVRLKSRIVVKGFSQVPGVDYTESFSPVANDTTIRICVVLSLASQWEIDVVDIEAAFLEADLEEEVFIDWPEGIVELGYATQDMVDEMVIQIDKAMYGLVQSPRSFFKTLTGFMKTFGMEQSIVDPCLWFKRNQESGEVELLLAIYVDDCVVCGTREMIEWWKLQIQNRFSISDLGPITKHIGVWYEKGEDAHGPYYNLTMDSYCKDFIESTEKLCGTIRRAKTPAYPNKVLGRRNQDEPSIKAEDYRSLVGTSLYMIKKVAPECSNAVRELTRHLDGPNPGHWKALMRLAGYFKTNKPSLKMRPTTSFQVIAYTDSNYATDEEDRKSISGFVVTLGGSVVSWQSKKQDTVSLSSCEAEYIASVHCAQEIRYVQQLVEELVGKQSPAQMFGDNNGAIFISKNSHVGPRTKHIDVRHHYLRELQANGHLEYLKIKGEDNPSDILTKNVTEQAHIRHGGDIKQGWLQHAIDQASKDSGSNSREDDESPEDPKPHNVRRSTSHISRK